MGRIPLEMREDRRNRIGPKPRRRFRRVHGLPYCRSLSNSSGEWSTQVSSIALSCVLLGASHVLTLIIVICVCVIGAGVLVSVDSYMNLQLVDTEEYVDGKSTGKLGEVMIRCVSEHSRFSTRCGVSTDNICVIPMLLCGRCNNVLYLRAAPEESGEAKGADTGGAADGGQAMEED